MGRTGRERQERRALAAASPQPKSTVSQSIIEWVTVTQRLSLSARWEGRIPRDSPSGRMAISWPAARSQSLRVSSQRAPSGAPRPRWRVDGDGCLRPRYRARARPFRLQAAPCQPQCAVGTRPAPRGRRQKIGMQPRSLSPEFELGAGSQEVGSGPEPRCIRSASVPGVDCGSDESTLRVIDANKRELQ